MHKTHKIKNFRAVKYVVSILLIVLFLFIWMLYEAGRKVNNMFTDVLCPFGLVDAPGQCQVADLSNLKNLGGNYSSAESTLYWDSVKVGNFDEKTFSVLGNSGYAKDQHSVYYGYEKVYGADAGTFTIINPAQSVVGPTKTDSLILGQGYAKDKYRAYYRGYPIYNSDASSFVLKDTNQKSDEACKVYAEDNNGCYSACASFRDNKGRSCYKVPQNFTERLGRFTIDLDENDWYHHYRNDSDSNLWAYNDKCDVNVGVASSASTLPDDVNLFIKGLISWDHEDLKIISRKSTVIDDRNAVIIDSTYRDYRGDNKRLYNVLVKGSNLYTFQGDCYDEGWAKFGDGVITSVKTMRVN